MDDKTITIRYSDFIRMLEGIRLLYQAKKLDRITRNNWAMFYVQMSSVNQVSIEDKEN